MAGPKSKRDSKNMKRKWRKPSSVCSRNWPKSTIWFSSLKPSKARRFMESLDLQDRTRIGAMNRKGAAASASASWSAAVLCRFRQRVAFAKRQRTAALQDLAEHWGGSGEASTVVLVFEDEDDDEDGST